MNRQNRKHFKLFQMGRGRMGSITKTTNQRYNVRFWTCGRCRHTIVQEEMPKECPKCRSKLVKRDRS